MKKDKKSIKKYYESCRKDNWQNIFRIERDYLARHLCGYCDVLSVGCGPAIIEGELTKLGFNVIGLDVSQTALGCVPDGVRTVAGRSEVLPFPDCFFDAVIFVASLQFVDDLRKTVDESARVLKQNGKLIAMLLNPESEFFKERFNRHSSYVCKIKHMRLDEIEHAMIKNYEIQTEYFMGISGGKTFQSHNPAEAALYIIQGRLL
jgi:SAM-dependent methyltransferase